MLTLHTSPASPFGRKVRLAAAALGLSDRIEPVSADTQAADSPLRRDNPLGKLPTLVLEDGSTLFDSRVIVEYLDHIAGGGRLIPAREGRFEVLRLQALADGIMDAALAQVYERRFRPEEKVHQPWLDHQDGKVSRALDSLERGDLPETTDIGTIALGCALSYLDFRLDPAWREGRPRLAAWYENVARAMPDFAETMPA